jgi:cAMP-dependent protein kinase regulator
LKKGDYFGEIALLTDKPRQATAKAVGDVKVLALDAGAFNRLCGPLFEILKRNMSLYDSYGADGAAKEFADQTGVAPEPEAEEDDDDKFTMEEEKALEEEERERFSRPKGPPARARGRMTSVFVAPINMEEQWQPKVIEKTAEQMGRISEMLTKTVLFAHLEEEQRKIVVGAMSEVHVAAGDNAIKQGDDGDFFYVVDQGTAEAHIERNGESKKVCDYEAGGCFGELALMHGDKRAATVKAVTDLTLWALDRDTFRRILMQTAFKKQQEYEAFLSKVPILSTLDKYERFRLSDALKVETYSADQVIIKQGDAGSIFYIVEEGEVICTKE